jgi:hypothetical protein
MLLYFSSCDSSGSIFITNGYPHNVRLYATFEYYGERFEKSILLLSHQSFAPAAMGHTEYSHIIFFRIEKLDGTFLSEYSTEYIIAIRNAIKKNETESWIFTEKGIFLETNEVSKKYNFDNNKIIQYYCSDEAVYDIDILLKKKKSQTNNNEIY